MAIAIDPGSDARSLATNAISTMSNSVFGNIVGPVFSADLLSLLGLGGTDEVGDYLDKIQSELEQMQGELVKLQQSVDQILAGIVVIEEKFTDVEVTNILLEFQKASATISQNFESYTNAIRGLTSTDPAQVNLAAQELFDLLSLLNLQTVATAMTNIQDYFVPTLSEQRGLLDLQHEVIQNAIHDFSPDPEKIRLHPSETTARTYRFIPTAEGFFASRLIIEQALGIANDQLEGPVASTFKAFLTLQTQGLILLMVGWLDTPQEPQLAAQAKAIQTVLDAMAGFETPVLKTIDDACAAHLQVHGKRLTGAATTGSPYWMTDGQWEAEADHGYPLSDDWIMWDSLSTTWDPDAELLLMAYQPWIYDPYAGYGFSCFLAQLYSNPPDEGNWIFASNVNRSQQTFVGQPGTEGFTANVPRASIPTGFQFIRTLKASPPAPAPAPADA